MPRTTRPAKASTSATEKVQEESSAHEESSGSDQEQDPEVFLQPSQAQVLPNMFMPYVEGPKSLSVSLPCYQKKGNARKLLLGVVILAWTSMFLGACPLI